VRERDELQQESTIAERLRLQRTALRVCEVREMLAISDSNLRRLIRRRAIPFHKVGGQFRFDPGELRVWWEQQRMQ
jgi:excisionase family DNA binding protein